MLGLSPTLVIWSNGNTPKLGWNRGGVHHEHKNLQCWWVDRLCSHTLTAKNSHEPADDTIWWRVRFSDHDGTRVEGGCSCVAVLVANSTRTVLPQQSCEDRIGLSLQYLWNDARQDQGYYDGLIGRRIRAFDWHKNQWPWMTLNGRNALLQNKRFYGAHQKNLNEDRPILSTAKCRSMILVFRNIKYMRILAGVPEGGDVKQQWGCRTR